jgi:hypothetical protein
VRHESQGENPGLFTDPAKNYPTGYDFALASALRPLGIKVEDAKGIDGLSAPRSLFLSFRWIFRLPYAPHRHQPMQAATSSSPSRSNMHVV